MEQNNHQIIVTSQTIYDILRSEILNLTIKPGQTISENQVCARFNVSRTPVRTAFQRLKDAGLVHIVPYKRSYVSLLDFDEITQLIYMRVALETSVIRDFILEADSKAMTRLEYILAQQKKLLMDEFEPDDFYTLDSNLHQQWFSYTKKMHLWGLIQKSQTNYTRFRMLDIVAEKSYDQIFQEHVELIQVIKEKRHEQVEPLIRYHLYGNVKRLGPKIQEELADYFVARPQA